MKDKKSFQWLGVFVIFAVASLMSNESKGMLDSDAFLLETSLLKRVPPPSLTYDIARELVKSKRAHGYAGAMLNNRVWELDDSLFVKSLRELPPEDITLATPLPLFKDQTLTQCPIVCYYFRQGTTERDAILLILSTQVSGDDLHFCQERQRRMKGGRCVDGAG